MFQMTCYRYTFLNVQWVCVVWFKAETYMTTIFNAIALITTATIVSTLGGRTTLPDADTDFSVADRWMKNEHGGMVLLVEPEALGEKCVPSANMSAINPAWYDLEAKQVDILPPDFANLVVKSLCTRLQLLCELWCIGVSLPRRLQY